MNKIFAGIAAITGILFFMACNSDKKPEPQLKENKIVRLGTQQTSDGIHVILMADSSILETGYNKLYVGLQLNGGILTSADVQFQPVMEMGGMMHSCPVEQPVLDTNLVAFSGAAIFTMPSADGMAWKLKVSVNGNDVYFPLYVVEAPHQVTGTYTGTDSTRYVISLIPPKKWQVGLNDFEILINKETDMMHFPGVNDFTVNFTPEMPSMGHSSPNNVDPESTGTGGYYKGTANFTMTGDWRLNFDLKRNDSLIVQGAYVDILF